MVFGLFSHRIPSRQVRTLIRPGSITVICLWLGTIVGWSQARIPLQLQRHEFLRYQLGTRTRLVLYCQTQQQAHTAAQRAFQRIEQLEAKLSDYQVDSEIRLLAEREVGRPVPVSPELFTVLEAALRMSRLSEGVFDVTVGPLSQLWRSKHQGGFSPTREQLRMARQRVGYSWVKIDRKRRTVRLDRPGMQLDLGGIAKGYLAELALQQLRQQGVKRALVDAGGDIVVGEAPPGRSGWRIQVAPSRSGRQAPALLLSSVAIATSGDRQWPGAAPGLLHPKSGAKGRPTNWVTVVASSGLWADALATTLSLLPAEKGLKLLEQHWPQAQARVEVEEAAGSREFTSKGWHLLLDGSGQPGVDH